MLSSGDKLDFMKDVVGNPGRKGVTQEGQTTGDSHGTIFSVRVSPGEFAAIDAEATLSGYKDQYSVTGQVFMHQSISPKADVAVSVWKR